MQIENDNGRIFSERTGTEDSEETGKVLNNNDVRAADSSLNNVVNGALLNDMVNDTSSLHGDSHNKQTRRNVGKILVPDYLEVRPGVLVQSCDDIGTSCIEIK